MSTREPAAALTFDDGPDPESTPRLLEILGRHGAKATFFMLGEQAVRSPELVRRVHEEGHAIGNHSWDHPRMPELGWWQRRRQLEMCEEALAPYGESLFRPPYTLQSFSSFLTARSLGYEIVAWGLHVDDWLDSNPEWMARRLIEHIRPGMIVLLHDAVRGGSEGRALDRTAMFEALDEALNSLGRALHFVTIPKLLRIGRPIRRPWFVRTDDDW